MQKSLKIPKQAQRSHPSNTPANRQSKTQSISDSINHKKNSAFSGKFGKSTKEAGMKRKEIEKSKNKEPDVVADHHLMDDFDARKAVIYSEILKRPQF